MTASQPRGLSSELRTETMVLAIPRSESEMWTREVRGRLKEGGVRQLKQRGRRRKTGGKTGSVLQPQEVAIVLYIPPENPSSDQAERFPSLPGPHPHRLYKHRHTWSQFVDEGLASVSVS